MARLATRCRHRGLLLVAALAVAAGCRRESTAPREEDSEDDAPPRVRLNGTGATFPAPLFEHWIAAYAPRDHRARFNYQPAGSGAGERQLEDRTTDFAVTDGAPREATATDDDGEGASRARLVQVPVAAGAVAAIYNFPRSAPLRLSSDVLARIFLGEITRWDDPALVVLNPGEALPAAAIVVVTRADGSGTSAAFSTYLANGNSTFRAKLGAGLTVSFPVGVGALGNAGMTSQVRSTPNALGYAELSVARGANLACAALQNDRGAFVSPEVDAVRAALAGPSSLPGARDAAYPVTATSYVVLRGEQPDTAKALALVRFLTWVLAEGQAMAPGLGYAPLPDALVAQARHALGSVSSRGKRLKPGLASD